MKNFNLIKFKWPTSGNFRSTNFPVNAIHPTFFLCIVLKFISYIHYTNSTDEFEIGQDSDREKVMAAKMIDYGPLFL